MTAARVHSPSSVDLGTRCAYAWALRYLMGIRDREVSWKQVEAGIECTSRERSTALGKAVHEVNEARYLGRRNPYKPNALPTLVAQSGFGLLPQPEKCNLIQVEHEIGELPSGHDKIKHAMRVHGVLWWGKRDLVVRAPGELRRLIGVSAATRARGTMLGDYKSSKNITRYAKSAEKLFTDVQCNLYALDVADAFRLQEVFARWLYLETQAKRRARAVDVFIPREHALEVLLAPCAKARELETITELTPDLMNPRACGDYGGCPHHKSAGGVCEARRSIGALIQARVVRKDQNSMALTPEQKAKFEAKKAAAAKANAASEEVETETEVTEDEVEVAPAKKAPVKKRAAKKVEAPVPTGKTAEIIALTEQLAAKQAEVDVVQSEVDALHAKIAEVAAA